MSIRWLTGVFLFALGCGSAMLVRLPASGATEGVVEGTLKYIDGEEFQLIYPPGGETDYLVVVSRKGGTAADSGPQVSYTTGSAVISKKDLESLTILQVTPVAFWNGEVVRCGSGPFLCPLPPPPPPPDHLRYMFVQSGPASAERPR